MIAVPLAFLITTNISGCVKKDAYITAKEPPASTEPALPSGKGGIYKTGNPYKVAGRWYTPMQGVSNYSEIGTASWYGSDFHGKLTANGERYDMHMLSAAHKTLPLPTLVRVTNLENGRTVIVRVNDRGPFVKERLIDLSYAAAKVLGYTHQGTARVHIQMLEQSVGTGKAESKPTTLKGTNIATATKAVDNNGNIFVQIAAFASEANANHLRRSLLTEYPSTALYTRQVADQVLYRVRVGPFSDMQQVEKTMLALQESGYSQAVAIIE